MRQDLQLHLLLRRKIDLESRRESLRQELRAQQRDLAGRADLERISTRVGQRGLRAPRQEQVLALVEEPRVQENPRSLPLAVLEILSGAGDVQASSSPPAAAPSVEEDEDGTGEGEGDR